MDEYQTLAGQLTPEQDNAARSRIWAGLMLDADSKWSSLEEIESIRNWVADLRNFFERTLGEIDPVSCEKIIVSVITGEPALMGEVPRGERTNLIGLMAFKFAYDKKMNSAEIEDFINKAADVAA